MECLISGNFEGNQDLERQIYKRSVRAIGIGIFSEMQIFLEIDSMKYLNFGPTLCLLVFLGLASDVFASSWTCQKAEFTREVVIFYPEAPARLPCKVFYAKPTENVLPRALWEAKYSQNYCEYKAEEFIGKLSDLGWRCLSSEL